MDIRTKIIHRFGWAYAIMIVFCTYIIVRVIFIQASPRWDREAEKMEIKEFTMNARRGDIVADDGSPLATSVPYYELRMDMGAPALREIFYSKVDSLALCLSRFLRDKSAGAYRAELRRAFAQQKRYYLISGKQVTYAQMHEIKTKFPILKNGPNRGGLIPIQSDRRVYPSGDDGIRTLGKLTQTATEEGATETIGAFGLEESFEKELKGEDGVAVKQNMSGRWFIVNKDQPVDGKNIVTTLDVRMQDQATYALRQQMERTHARSGTAILMEVSTGDIKAITNMGRNSQGELIAGFNNYSFGDAGLREPGSTFKLASYMAALEDGKIDTSTMVDAGTGIWKYKGFDIKDSDYKKGGGGGHGKVTAKHAFELSSNIGCAKLITQSYTGHEQAYIDRIKSLGIFEDIRLGIKGEVRPRIKKPGDPDWSGISLALISYGYEIKLTPLQILTFYNAVANDGCMMKPRLVKGVTDNGHYVEKIGTDRLKWSVCSPRTLRMVRAMLEGVVTDGTATNLQTPNYKIAGKSGTAQVYDQKKGYGREGQRTYQASFAGYFPADNPKYSCIVVISDPRGGDYFGATVAGPVFRQIADYVYAYQLGMREEENPPMPKVDNDIPGLTAGRKKDLANVLDELNILNGFAFTKSEWVEAKPDEDGLELSNREVQKGMVPNVKGMGATDAVFLLESNGMRVSVQGRGKVKSQSVRAGSKIQRGQRVVLILS